MKNKLLISVLAATTLISGTYALESFGVINSVQTIDTIEVAGGRIHDYFNGSNKDVFVENYMTGDDATYIYARIQLREYMEYGQNNKIILRGDIQNTTEPVLSNEDTWDIFQYKTSTKSPIRTYKDLKLGGKSVYMPTFNQDNTNKEIELKGSLSDANGNIKTEPYDDYKSYNVGDKESGTIITEGNQSGATLTHTADETNTAIIYTMEEWFNAGSPIQNAWVFDTDGWAYYAAPIPAGSTSGLLIDEVLTYKSPTESWYYAVNVNGQLATAGDWGHKDDSNTESSMYASNMTDEGVYVLNKAAGLITVDNMEIKDSDGDSLSDDDINLSLGDSIQYRVSFNVINGIGDPDENLVTWSVSEPTGTLTDIADSLTVDGLFTPSDKMKGYEFVITVTSQLDTRKSQSISVFVENNLGVTNAYIDELVGTTNTISIDGQNFYVIDRLDKVNEDGDTFDGAFLWIDHPIKVNGEYFSSAFATTAADGYELSSWKESLIRKNLADILENFETLDAYSHSVETTINGFTSGLPEESYDRIFLLSMGEIDYYELESTTRAQDNGGTIPTMTGRYIRSPYSTYQVYGLGAGGGAYYSGSTASIRAVRPGFWVEL